MKEIWRPVEGYMGRYEVSNFGRVKSLHNNIILKPKLEKNGYFRVCLYEDNKKKKFYSIHRLVAMAFIPNPNNYPQINHKNEIRTDNRVDNLEWCTAKYNMNYGNRITRAALSCSKPIKCVETGIIYQSARKIEELFGYKNQSISKCCNGLRHTCGGYHWEFVD